MNMTRRGFVGAAFAAGVWGTRESLGGSRSCATAAGSADAIKCVPPSSDAQERVPPHLVLGVLSDIHIFDEKQVPVFERALEFFRDRKADGVIIAGDMADRGLVDQLELVGKAWFKVFPENRRPDGQPIEKLFVYGNHDVQGHGYGDTPKKLAAKYPDEATRAAHRIVTDRKAVWERVFKEPWTGVYAKQVKGYTFIGSHWGYEKELEAFLKANESKLGLKGKKPFFYAQHPHPGDTVQGPWAWGHDRGVATRALSAYPNAVAFSGHSHYSLTDERCVWQGAFTSIGTSSLSYIFAQYWRENGEDHDKVLMQMPLLPEHLGKQGMLVSVYDDKLVIERREFLGGEKVGPDWHVPLDGSRAFAFDVRGAKMVAPEFAAGASVTVTRAMGKDRRGTATDQVTVHFPAAKPSATSRVYDYEVQAFAYHEDVDYPVASKRVLSESFHLPPTREATKGMCVFAASELPKKGTKVRFVVRPTECYGHKGRAIVSDLFEM